MTDTEQPSQITANDFIEVSDDAWNLANAIVLCDAGVDETAALIQRAFAEREAELVGALNLARPILASTAPRMGVISEGKIVTAGQAFDAVMDALKSREAGHG